jgi:hypothetical protein
MIPLRKSLRALPPSPLKPIPGGDFLRDGSGQPGSEHACAGVKIPACGFRGKVAHQFGRRRQALIDDPFIRR